MENARPARIAFIVLFALLIIGFWRILRPFATPAFIALLMVIIFSPIHRIMLRLARNRRHIASLLSTLFVSACILAPLAVVVGVIIMSFSNVIVYVTSQLQSGQVGQAIDSLNIWLNTKVSDYADWLPANFDLKTAIMGFIASISKVIYQYSPKVISATAGVIGGVVITVLFMFGLFANGPRIYRTVESILPLEASHKELLAREIRFVISGTFLGMIATAVAQGILIGIGFWIAGISNPAFWGLVAIGVTLIPVVGGPLMYVPAGIALIIGGHLGSGIFILLFGVGIVSTIDNVIKPLVMRGKVNVNPLLLAMGIVGGGMWLGPVGLILGPLIVVLMLTMVDIYRREFI